MKRITYLCAIGLGATHLSRLVRHKIYKQYVQVLFGHRVVNTSEPLYTFLRQLGFSTLEEFDRRIQYLSKHYTPISIDECAEYLDGRKVASSSMIALTFDDGYRSIYTHIFPLLKKYHIPAMVFLTTDCLSKNCILVNDRLLYIIGATRVTQFALPELGPETYSLAGESQRVQVYTEISARLKRIPNGEKVAIIEKLSEVLPVDESELRQNIRMLSWPEIREMLDSGLVTFGAHTASHPILSRVPIEEAKQELLHSKLIIEEQLKVPVRFLAYPNGTAEDFNETIKEVVRQSGYELAFTTISKPFHRYDSYEVPRRSIDREDFSRFKLRMSGFFDILRALRDKVGKLTASRKFFNGLLRR